LDPYAAGLLVGGITFLIIFRMTQSYGRYWEATTAVYRMQSKWMDATVHTSDFHLQSTQYESIKPPSFKHYAPDLDSKFLTRSRESVRPSRFHRGVTGKMNKKRAVMKSINSVTSNEFLFSGNSVNNSKAEATLSPLQTVNQMPTSRFFQSANSCEQLESAEGSQSGRDRSAMDMKIPRFLTGPAKMDGNWGALFPDGKSTYRDPKNPYPDRNGFASIQGGRTPPLFLQELAHLSSLLNAVAL
jgi:hypothetical protein